MAIPAAAAAETAAGATAARGAAAAGSRAAAGGSRARGRVAAGKTKRRPKPAGGRGELDEVIASDSGSRAAGASEDQGDEQQQPAAASEDQGDEQQQPAGASEDQGDERGREWRLPAKGSPLDTGAGFVLGAIAWAVAINWVRGGWPQARGWIVAKLINRPYGSPAQQQPPARPDTPFRI